MSESLELSLTVNRASATLPDLAPIAWLGNAIEAAALWFFGRGMFSLTLTRRRNDPEALALTVTPSGECGPLNFSGAAPISSLVLAQRFPMRLVEPWEPFKDDQREVTMIQSYSLKEDTSLAMLAYGLADATCDFFKRGAMSVEAQYSPAQCQIRRDVGLDDDQLAQLAEPSAQLRRRRLCRHAAVAEKRFTSRMTNQPNNSRMSHVLLVNQISVRPQRQ